MSDLYYTSDFRTETDERGDVRTVSGDEQLAQQMITIAGNTLREVLVTPVPSAEDVAEFSGAVQTRLDGLDRVGDVRTVEATFDRQSETLTVQIETTLADVTETFTLPS